MDKIEIHDEICELSEHELDTVKGGVLPVLIGAAAVAGAVIVGYELYTYMKAHYK